MKTAKSRTKIVITPNKEACGREAAAFGARCIRAALRRRGKACIIVATGASQFEMLKHLVQSPGIDWSKVTAFHLDEYVGLPLKHPASFRRYLWERFVSRLPLPLARFHYINAEKNPHGECRRLAEQIKGQTIDVCFAGIGENGHLAFNDPPADFEAKEPYLVVELDAACRRQQMGEGWFPTLGRVPKRAVSMSVRQIMKSETIICTVPDRRKARAVRDSFCGDVAPDHPASILQRHPATVCFLDKASASLLRKSTPR
jgi:glucosamine-6-phosphate deaminase